MDTSEQYITGWLRSDYIVDCHKLISIKVHDVETDTYEEYRWDGDKWV